MSKLNDLLRAIETGFVELDPRHGKEGLDNNRSITASRVQLANQIGQIAGEAQADVRLQSDPALAAEFEQRLTEWRHSVAQFQANWRVSSPDLDWKSYHAEVARARENNLQFLRWAQQKLAA